MLSVHAAMKDLFPFNSLSAKQTVIVGELLRDHPDGRIENDNGKPVFVSELGDSSIRIPLTATNEGRLSEHSTIGEQRDV
jgi:hypothetical protein